MQPSENLVWLDMEMSGLNPEIDRILEVAVIITNSQLETIAEAPVITVFQKDEVLGAMDEWNTRQHKASGLVDRVRRLGVSEKEAEARLLEFLGLYVEKGTSPLCGNSVGQDRRFMVRYMPLLDEFLHYRILDVSSIKELARRWRPDIYAGLNQKGEHRALEDTRESIEELKYYRDHFFKLE